jgi:2-aminobenzoate-CoA ligase
MADSSFLDWPFFDDSHRALARRAEDWWRREGAALPDGGGRDGDAWEACREIVRRLGDAGWLRHAVPAAWAGSAALATSEVAARAAGMTGTVEAAEAEAVGTALRSPHPEVSGGDGGGGLDVRSLCLLREIFARGSALADFAFALQGLGSGPLSLFGSEAQRREYLPRVAAGRAIAAFALSEAEAGSDVGAMQTLARRDGGDYVLDGQKTWISNAGIADFYVVFCRLPEGGERSYAAFVVDADRPGLRIGERFDAISPHPLGRLDLEGCRVPASALIGEPGRGLRVALATLDLFRPTVGAAALGFARRALDEALAQARRRRVFGRPLGDHQLTQARLADMATAVDASALLVYRAAWARDRGGAARVTREAAMAKLFATEAAQRVVDDAVQLLGARGVLAGAPVERLYREVRALRIYEGTSEIQRLVIAGQLLAGAEGAAATPVAAGNARSAGAGPALAPGEGQPTAHRDPFCRAALPPRELWPEMRYDTLPELAYPARLNCAAELLDRRVEAGDGERTAIHFPGGRWTYRQLLAAANRIAHALVEDLGVVPGNRVLLRGANTPMLAACWFAVLKAGGVAVTTMPLLRVRELAYIADKAQIRLALTDARVAADCEQAMRATAAGAPRAGARVVKFQAAGEAGAATEEESGEAGLERLARGKPEELANCDTAADDVALIAFTSGTTGQGKGTMHFHRDVLAATDCFPRYVLRPERDDVFCGSPPLAFTYGLGGLLLFPLRIGAATLLLEQATPPHLLAGIQEHRATVCFTAPTAYRAMCGLLDRYDVSSLRQCVSAGETLPLPTFEAWRRATGIKIIDGIGSTELLHMFISSSGDEIRPGATGRVVPGYEARVVDERGSDVPPGTVGRLAVRGPTGCRYLDNVDRQQVYVQRGWNFTGDSYLQDGDGYFWYQARTDDMIISAGNNIAGPEVEAVLLEHPKVRECGVVGLPDEERGQVVTAFVVLAPGIEASAATAKELQDFVKAELAPYKYPRRVEFVDCLPRTETGKLQRFRLRQGTP